MASNDRLDSKTTFFALACRENKMITVGFKNRLIVYMIAPLIILNQWSHKLLYPPKTLVHPLLNKGIPLMTLPIGFYFTLPSPCLRFDLHRTHSFGWTSLDQEIVNLC